MQDTCLFRQTLSILAGIPSKHWMCLARHVPPHVRDFMSTAFQRLGYPGQTYLIHVGRLLEMVPGDVACCQLRSRSI